MWWRPRHSIVARRRIVVYDSSWIIWGVCVCEMLECTPCRHAPRTSCRTCSRSYIVCCASIPTPTRRERVWWTSSYLMRHWAWRACSSWSPNSSWSWLEAALVRVMLNVYFYLFMHHRHATNSASFSAIRLHHVSVQFSDVGWLALQDVEVVGGQFHLQVPPWSTHWSDYGREAYLQLRWEGIIFTTPWHHRSLTSWWRNWSLSSRASIFRTSLRVIAITVSCFAWTPTKGINRIAKGIQTRAPNCRARNI